MMKPSTRVAHRRRHAVHVGLALIVFASLGFVASACIFDQGDYQGGNRLPSGATANQQSVNGSTSSSSSGDDDDTGLDASFFDVFH